MTNMETPLIAEKVTVLNVWIDGTEEIDTVQASCPKSGCTGRVITMFFVPWDTLKIGVCPVCNTKVAIEWAPEKWQG